MEVVSDSIAISHIKILISERPLAKFDNIGTLPSINTDDGTHWSNPSSIFPTKDQDFEKSQIIYNHTEVQNSDTIKNSQNISMVHL